MKTKRLMIPAVAGLFIFFSLTSVFAGVKATPDELFDKLTKAAFVIEQMGDEGLKVFNDPKGEFIWKDTYVFVLDCKKNMIIASPHAKQIGLTADVVKCKKTGRPVLADGCKNLNPEGFWLEYWWPKVGKEGIFRKVSLLIQVPGTYYSVGGGIYDKNISIEKLRKITK